MKRICSSSRLLVFVLFIGFQAAQIFHTHKTNLPDDRCSTCTCIYQTPSVPVPTVAGLSVNFIYQPFLSERNEVVVSLASFSLLHTRAPPAL